MESEKLRIIQELMEELQGEMEPGEDDFSDRLGRPKPKIEMMKMESNDDPGMDGGMEMDPDEGGEMDPMDMMLKKRLMKMRA